MLDCFPNYKPPLRISPYDAVERASLERDTAVLLRAEDAGGRKPELRQTQCDWTDPTVPRPPQPALKTRQTARLPNGTKDT